MFSSYWPDDRLADWRAVVEYNPVSPSLHGSAPCQAWQHSQIEMVRLVVV